MVTFALTGGSGAGKSTAAEIFCELGVYVIDADKIAKQVVEKGKPCLEELCAEFGNGIVRHDGELDRKKLGSIVFTDENKLKSLNAIVHKYIKEVILSELSGLDCELAAIDGAVIIGSEIEKLCAFTVSVLAGRETRIGRIIERDGLSEAEAQNRLNSQPDDSFYRENSRYVIYNDGSREELTAKIKEVYEKIRENEV